ncbi:phage tail fiber C-terminal domain-containing protein [Escherichia coli]|uniref:phage tail fiber C-terminal domain-containing protein n=1 Tax=Escherichia coli TaxID=562 RepID=UPI001D13DF4B|nr:phage tail fiber C-terminal domain-containing protein [Escherichia coli]
MSKGKLIDTGFCIFALSKLAMALSSTLDSIPLQCVVRPLQILRADGTWENIGGMK